MGWSGRCEWEGVGGAYLVPPQLEAECCLCRGSGGRHGRQGR